MTNYFQTGKTRGLFQSDEEEIRDESEKRRGETKHCSLSGHRRLKRVLTVRADGTPPDDNAHSINPHKQTEKVWFVKLLFHGDRGKGHKHIITPVGKEEERRVLARMYLTSAER